MTSHADPNDDGLAQRPWIDALLASTGLDIIELESDAGHDVAGATHRWRFRCGDVAEVDVYVCVDPQAAVNHLWSATSPDDDGFPALGQNGVLVYLVHHLGVASDRTSVYAALDVCSALAGDE